MISAVSNIPDKHNSSEAAVYPISERAIQAASETAEIKSKETVPQTKWSETDEAFYQGLLHLSPNDTAAIETYIQEFNSTHSSPYHSLAQQIEVLGKITEKLTDDSGHQDLAKNTNAILNSKWGLEMFTSQWMSEVILSDGKSPEETDW
ncbi:hypothetical protein [Iodobacter ciconiae]|uniref:Uncharacterized protein n=1 Tax=Iodobacter ciconiae TaxID=2496266 RepID=A0A3S8ZR06_9NEIS|nr:hypothetical protein [Iodobacter ciconiae]AZN35909.1 hypothetical protein EJO50_05075 [Iodobacter ciconiae]